MFIYIHICIHCYIHLYVYLLYVMQYLKDPLIIESSIFYHLRRENGSAEAWRKRGGRSAEAQPFRPFYNNDNDNNNFYLSGAR